MQVSIFIIRNAVEDLYADGVVGHAQRVGEKKLDTLSPDRAANTVGRGFDISADRHFLRRLWQLLGSRGFSIGNLGIIRAFLVLILRRLSRNRRLIRLVFLRLFKLMLIDSLRYAVDRSGFHPLCTVKDPSDKQAQRKHLCGGFHAAAGDFFPSGIAYAAAKRKQHREREHGNERRVCVCGADGEQVDHTADNARSQTADFLSPK